MEPLPTFILERARSAKAGEAKRRTLGSNPRGGRVAERVDAAKCPSILNLQRRESLQVVPGPGTGSAGYAEACPAFFPIPSSSTEVLPIYSRQRRCLRGSHNFAATPPQTLPGSSVGNPVHVPNLRTVGSRDG